MKNTSSVVAADLDWAAIWTSMQQKVNAVRANVARSGPLDRWKLRAERYDKMSRKSEGEGIPFVVQQNLRPSDVVIDIGAGTGRHSIAFSRLCSKVIAIEPSEAMRARLLQRIEEESVTNIEIVDSIWPAQSPIVADVLFSSHVLYGVEDAAKFLLEMTESSRRFCALYLGIRPPSAALDPFWTHIHGPVVPTRPAALEALGILYQLGIHADLQVLANTERELTFSESDDDMVELCHRLSLEKTEVNLARVRQTLCSVGTLVDEATYSLGKTGPNVVISWQR